MAGSSHQPGHGTSRVTLGMEVEHGQQPQVLVPGGHWQRARPAGERGVLVSCVVSPGFDWADFELGPHCEIGPSSAIPQGESPGQGGGG
ncbi:MAG TPA: cupin domain-containing protein [Pseudonocardiaceae bacterium]|nr:cupin domain-containing protein [Pseudonocardiaceae bacterium]